MKAAGTTDVGKLAGSISKNLDELPSGQAVEVIAIGASAVNQACKSIATASAHAASKGEELDIKVGFLTVEVPGVSGTEERTALKFVIRYKD